MLRIWGCGEFGQHGHGTEEEITFEKSQLAITANSNVKAISCGSSHTLALTDDNQLYSWGNNVSGQLGIGSLETQFSKPQHITNQDLVTKTISGIECGSRHSFVWTDDGSCYGFGNNFDAQLGYEYGTSNYKNNQNAPVLIKSLQIFRLHIIQVASGSRHTMFLLQDGMLLAVGSNNRGQLGKGDQQDAVVPTPIKCAEKFTSVACGTHHTLSITVQGELYAWGYSVACGSKHDIRLPTLIKVGDRKEFKLIKAAGGDSHSAVLTKDGHVFAWGSNAQGQLGIGNIQQCSSQPKLIETLWVEGQTTDISASDNMTAAVVTNTRLFIWGKNWKSLITKEAKPNSVCSKPVEIKSPIEHGTYQIACGSWHIAVIESKEIRHNLRRQEVTSKTCETTNSSFETTGAQGFLNDFENQDCVMYHMDNVKDHVCVAGRRQAQRECKANYEDSERSSDSENSLRRVSEVNLSGLSENKSVSKQIGEFNDYKTGSGNLGKDAKIKQKRLNPYTKVTSDYEKHLISTQKDPVCSKNNPALPPALPKLLQKSHSFTVGEIKHTTGEISSLLRLPHLDPVAAWCPTKGSETKNGKDEVNSVGSLPEKEYVERRLSKTASFPYYKLSSSFGSSGENRKTCSCHKDQIRRPESSSAVLRNPRLHNLNLALEDNERLSVQVQPNQGLHRNGRIGTGLSREKLKNKHLYKDESLAAKVSILSQL